MAHVPGVVIPVLVAVFMFDVFKAMKLGQLSLILGDGSVLFILPGLWSNVCRTSSWSAAWIYRTASTSQQRMRKGAEGAFLLWFVLPAAAVECALWILIRVPPADAVAFSAAMLTVAIAGIDHVAKHAEGLPLSTGVHRISVRRTMLDVVTGIALVATFVTLVAVYDLDQKWFAIVSSCLLLTSWLGVLGPVRLKAAAHTSAPA